jgi:ElaB/YqjD/DUF883 family membrane-anchored ribosome-binding protein
MEPNQTQNPNGDIFDHRNGNHSQKADQIAQDIKNETQKYADTAKSYVNTAVDKVQDVTNQARAKGQEMMGQMQEKGQEAKDQLMEAATRADTYAKSNPWPLIGLAAACGFIAGLMCQSSSSRKED